jgi:UDP-4-amino-4,6-dideoxy-N-acetyl-beta-L-altrosamine N-acetyltransferase
MAADVQLRPLAPDDSARLFAWRNSPDVAAYMYIAPDEHAHWFAAIPGDARRVYWIIQVDGTPVGLANLYDIDRAHGRAAWAYYLADPAVRGKGVGGYVEYWMIQHAFLALGLRKLWCEVLASNEAVWRMHLKYGFVQEARFRAHVLKGGAPQDVLGLGLLAEEWAAVRPAMAERLARMGFLVAE